MLHKLGKFLFRVNFNGFLLGLDKLALFKPCLPGTWCNCIDLLVLILFWSSTLLSSSSSDIFNSFVWSFIFEIFKIQISQKFGNSGSIVSV